jgi:NADPH:quinone reductase
MRAAQVHAWGSAPVLEDIPSPRLRPGETIVQLSAAAVGHFDLSVARGERPPGPPLPYVPGTDGAGGVLASDLYGRGTRVRVAGGGLGVRRDGTWAEVVAAPDEALEPIPRGVDPAVAASFSVPAAAALTALEHVGHLQPGERVAVTGAAGAVGSLTVQLARRAGAGPVFGIVSRASKASWVPAGATAVVGRGAEVVERLLEEAAGIDLLVDTVGGSGLAELLPAMSVGGRVVLVGYTAGRGVTLDLPTVIDLAVSLLPLNLFADPARTREATATAFGLLRDGGLHLPLTRFSLEDMGEAVESLAKGATVGRVVVVPAVGQQSVGVDPGGGHEQTAA